MSEDRGRASGGDPIAGLDVEMGRRAPGDLDLGPRPFDDGKDRRVGCFAKARLLGVPYRDSANLGATGDEPKMVQR